MKLLGLLLACSLAAFAAGEAVLIQNADIYPMNGAPLKGGSLLIQDGKIIDIGAKITAPKGATVLEGKGLRVYPGWIDSGTELGLEEIGSIRETNDTGEIGEFNPQLKALSAVNPDSEHFGVVRVNGITSAIALPGGGGGRGGGGGSLISGQAALLHTDGWTWEEMEINRSAAMLLNFPSAAGRGGRAAECRRTCRICSPTRLAPATRVAPSSIRLPSSTPSLTTPVSTRWRKRQICRTSARISASRP
ncbi:MAG: hypothetical protein WDO73_15350 [Ignavibacteriota bacterium]